MSADAGLRDSLAGLSTPILLRRCAQLAPADQQPYADTVGIARYTLALLADRIHRLSQEIRELNHRLTTD